jgi:hypothetical protein
VPQVIEQRFGTGLANRVRHLGGLAADLFLDAVESADARDGLRGDGRDVYGVNVMELTPCMRPACDLVDRAIAYR